MCDLHEIPYFRKFLTFLPPLHVRTWDFLFPVIVGEDNLVSDDTSNKKRTKKNERLTSKKSKSNAESSIFNLRFC